MDIKECIYCKKLILKSQRGVLLKTFEGDETIEKVWFHLKCYKEWHDKKAIEKSQKQMEKLIGNSMNVAKKLIKQDGTKQYTIC